MAEFFDSMDEVLAELQRQNALPDFANPTVSSGLGAGRGFETEDAESSLRRIEQAAKKAHDAGLEASTVWNKVESKLRQQGYRMVIRRSPRGRNEFEIFAVPDNLSKQERQDMKVLTQYPNLVWSGLENGLSSRYGQKTIDQGRLDYLDGALAFYTNATQQAQAILNRLTNPRGGNNTRYNDYAKLARNAKNEFERRIAQRHIKSSVANAERHANSGYNAVNSYQTDELWKMMQGTGTARSIAMRQSLVSIRPMVDSILNKEFKQIIQAYGKANPSRQLTNQQFKARAEQDIFHTLYWYLQNRQVDALEKELTEASSKGWNAGYLWKNPEIRKVLQNAGRQLHSLGADVGLTGESSANQMMINLLRHGDIGLFGSLGDKSGRKPMQVAQMRQRQQRAQEALVKALANPATSGGLYGKRRVYTGWEVAAGLDKLAEEQAQTGVMFATAEEIREAQQALMTREKNKRSAASVGYGSLPHNGGIFYSKALGATLDSHQQRSMSVSMEAFKRAQDKLVDKLLTPETRADTIKSVAKSIKAGAAQQAAFTQWMSTFAPDQRIDQQQFWEALEAQEFAAAYAEALQRQTSREILRSQKGIKLSTVGDLARVIERDPMGKDQVTIEWLEKHAMQSGEKLLGGAHFVKGRAKEIEYFQDLVKEIWIKRGKSENTAERLASRIGLMMEPEKLTSRNPDAFLAAFFDEITRALGGAGGSQTLLNSFIESVNQTVDGKKWLEQEGDHWKTNFDRFARRPDDSDAKIQEALQSYVKQVQHGLADVTEQLTKRAEKLTNDALKNDVNALNDELTMMSQALTIKDGQLKYDPKQFIGATTVGQHHAYDYGDPGRAVLNADYRLIGAISRGILRSNLGGTTSPEYARALLGQRSRNGTPNGQYAWQLDLDANGNIINAGQFGGTAESRRAHEQWVKSLAAVNDAKQWMNTQGGTWTVANWMAKGNQDIVLGHGQLEEFLGAHGVDTGALSKKQLAQLKKRYLDVSGLHKGSFVYRGEFDEGHTSAAEYASSFGLLAELEKANAGRVLFVPLNGGIAGSSLGKQLVTSAIALPRMDALGGAVETILANGNRGYDIPEPLRILPSLINAQDDVYFARAGQLSITPKQASEAFTQAAFENIGRMVASVESKNGSVWQAGNKAKQYHSAIRHATAPDVEGGAWGALGDVATRMNPEDLEAMLSKQDPDQTDAEYLSQLQTQYYYLYSNLVEDPQKLEDMWSAVRGQYKGREALTKYLTELVTRGSAAFNARAELAKEGVTLHGLAGFGFRYPLSNAEDSRAADIFADSELASGEVVAALGAGAGQNLDFDGDTYATVLQMLGTNDPAERAKLVAQMVRQNEVDQNLMRRQADAFRADYEEELKSGVSLESIARAEAGEVAAVTSRLNKGFTGRFSNQFQAISEALSLNEPWADRDTPMNAEERAAFLQNQVVRAVYESFTQDAISAKKVRQRIENRYGSAWAGNAGYLSEMDKLYELIQGKNTYAGIESIKDLVTLAQDLKILGTDDEGGVFGWRLNSQLLAKMDQFSDDEVAKALGVSTDIVRAWKDPSNKAATLGLTGDQLARLIDTVNTRVKRDTGSDIGAVIRDKMNRAGGIDATSDPIYRVGTDTGTEAQYEQVKETNAALAEAGAQAGAFGEALKKATTALDAATDEVKESTATAQKRDDVLENLEYALKNRATDAPVAVTSLTSSLAGGNFASALDKAAFEEALILAHTDNPNAIQSLEGYDAETFKKLRNGLLGSRRGTIADQVEQLVNTYGLDTSQVNSVDDFIKLVEADPNARQALYEYNPSEHAIGLGVLLGRGDESIYGKDSDALKAAQRNRALQEALFGTENVDADQWSQLIKGFNLAEALRRMAYNMGGQFIGHEFGVVGGNGAGNAAGWNHGRIDLLMKSVGTRSDGSTYNILDVFDKKSIGNLSQLDKYGPGLNYLAQVAVYAEDLRQLQAYINKHDIKTLGQLKNNKEYYQNAWLAKGGREIDDETFALLSDPRTLIRAALTYVDDYGNIRNYDVGSGLGGDKALMQRLANYAMHEIPEAKWEPGDAEAIKQITRINNRGVAFGGHGGGGGGGPVIPIAGGGSGANRTGGGGLSGLLGRQLSMYFGRILGGTGLYRLFAKVRQGITFLVKEATELDKTLTNLQITTGGTREDTRQLLSTYAQLGRQLGATTQEVAASALEWQRQGYEAGEVADLVTSSLYLSKLGMIDASTATQNLTSALKGFKIAASESMDVVDKLTAIDLKAATSAGEIANGLAQFANIGSLSGVNIDEAAAYVATIADVTQMSGSSAGQALKTIISRYGNVKAGAFNKMTLDADTGDGTTLNDVERVLSKLGISIRDSNLSFKDFSTILEEIASRWQTLDNVSQRAIANAFAGVRQQEAFTTLLQNWDKYQELLTASQRSKGTASTKYEAYQQSLEAARSARQTVWEELANNAEISELLITVNKIGEDLGRFLPQLLEHGTQILISLTQLLEIWGKGALGRAYQSLQQTGLFQEKLITREKQKQHKLEQKQTAENQQQLNLEKQETQVAGKSGKGASGAGAVNKAGRAQVVISGLSYGIGQILSGLTAYQTSGLTHDFVQSNGETVTVNSSRRAKEAGRTEAALWAGAIPFIGSWIGSHRAQRITAAIDKERDEANEVTRVAQANLKVLSATSGNLATMVHLRNAATAAEEAERDAATAEYIAEVYKSENAAVRELLTRQLTRIDSKLGSIYQVTEAMHTGTAQDRARASHVLELAHLTTTHLQERKSRAAEDYAAQETLREAYLQYNMSREGYTQDGITAAADAYNKQKALNTGLGVGGLVGAGTAGAMLGTAAITSAAIPVAGWIAALAIAAVAGSLGYAGAYAGETAKSETAEARAWAFNQEWNTLGLDEKIQTLIDTESQLIQSIDEGNDANMQQLEATRALRQSFEEYREMLRAQQDTDNKARMDEALLYAGWQADATRNTSITDIASTEYFLKDLNLVQAKNYGQEALYAALAAALGEDGLHGTKIKVGDRYTDYFVTYARRIMSENDAVGSVLSGEAYTLYEALDELGSKSDQFSQAILQDFARAMRVANDELAEYSGLLGELTLAELLMNTTELEEEFDSWSGLLGKVADSTQSVTKWMTDIVAHYPDLINYMSSTPTLIQKIVDKLMDLNNQTMRQQYEEYGESQSFWEKTVRPGAEAWLQAQVAAEEMSEAERAAVLKLLQDKNLTRLNEALTTLGAMAGLDPDSDLYKTYQNLQKAVTAGTGGVTLRSDLWTEQTQKLTNFIAEQLRVQVQALEAQKEALQDVNKQRQFEVDLLNARNKLSDALNQKQRVYRTGVGFVYEPDQGAIKKAQEELKEVQLQKDVSKITKQIDTLQAEAQNWEAWWSNRTKELQQNVFADIWGGSNLEDFKAKLFGGSNTILSVDPQKGLLVDNASLTTTLGELFGTGTTMGSFTSSLHTMIWGSTVTAPTWFSQTFATSFASLDKYFETLVGDRERNNSDLLAKAEEAYKRYKELAYDRGRGKQIDPDEWNAVLDEYATAFSNAKTAGAITEDWAYDKKHSLNARDHSEGSVYQYLYDPYYLGTHTEIQKRLKEWDYVEPQVGAAFQKAYAVQIGDSEMKLKKGANGQAWDWARVAMTDYAPIDSGIGTGLNGDVAYALRNAAGKTANAWYWTADTLGTHGAAVSRDMSNQKLKAALSASADWGSVAEKMKDEPETLVWTPDYGYVLLSNGHAYLASYMASLPGYTDAEILANTTGGLLDANKQFWNDVGDVVGTAGNGAVSAYSNPTTAFNIGLVHAKGTLSTSGPALLNEEGVEAIVTPAGTITTLPSHTGIVPADITRNLWQLGEVAPSILRVAEAIAPNSIINGNSKSAITDQSFNINNLSMSVNADDSFDVDAFIEAIKSRVALTHHAHR